MCVCVCVCVSQSVCLRIGEENRKGRNGGEREGVQDRGTGTRQADNNPQLAQTRAMVTLPRSPTLPANTRTHKI